MWYGVGVGVILYLVLLFTLGVITLRKGHWVMFIIGIFLPIFWLIGAVIPPVQRARRRASESACRGSKRPNIIERQMSALLRSPPRVTTAATVIVTATAMAVVVGGVLMRVLDHKEYANVWVGMWWAIQTVTTVGYGDVTPKATSGRIVAVLVMLEGIALLTVVIAGITSTFVARAQRELAAGEAAEDDAAEARVETRLDDLSARLERVESMLRS